LLLERDKLSSLKSALITITSMSISMNTTTSTSMRLKRRLRLRKNQLLLRQMPLLGLVRKFHQQLQMDHLLRKKKLRNLTAMLLKSTTIIKMVTEVGEVVVAVSVETRTSTIENITPMKRVSL
jgi:hypothetical protein